MFSYAMIMLILSLPAFSQQKAMKLGKIENYKTLKCDFHMHTVFSDGIVWPDYRIYEAHRDGLDAITISEHIEYLKYNEFVKGDHNASYNIAKDLAKKMNIILIRGAEITRDMPPGHFNALFINDANKLTDPDFMKVVEEVISQGGFIHYNHPGWKGQQKDGIPKLYDVHKEMLAKGWMHGVEFANENEFYPSVMNWVNGYDLTIFANSDIHGVVSENFDYADGGHRPMTIVFAKERSENSIKEALFAKRTLALFSHKIAGKEKIANQYFNGSIEINKPHFEDDKELYFIIENKTDIPFELNKIDGSGPEIIELGKRSQTIVKVNKPTKGSLKYSVSNIFIGENKNLEVNLNY